MKKATIYDYARLCKQFSNCFPCPLNKFCAAQIDVFSNDTDKANEIILKWCEEHPVETRQDRFLKMFPNAKTDSDGIIKILPCSLEENIVTTMPSTCSYIHGSCNECRKEYWLAEVDE